VPKWLKTCIPIVLLPFCYGAVRALFRVVALTGQAGSIWIPLLGGMACWLAVYLLLPRPMLVYVFGHELTHVLWTWVFGGRVKRFKVSSKGGHVVVSKSNFLVALAPYFFPIYVMVVIGVYAVGDLSWGWRSYVVWFHWLVGVAYGFHLTLTWHILQTRQSDISSHGWFFSTVVIFLGNIAVLLLGLAFLTAKASVLTVLGWWMQESGAIVVRMGQWW
jgi:hypothetical protein